MNQDILSGNWHQLKGKVRKFWGELTDDEVDKVGGRIEELSGLLQKRYGYRKTQAQHEIDKFLAEQED